MARIVHNVGKHNISQLDPAFKSLAANVIAGIPSTFQGLEVTVNIEGVLRPAKKAEYDKAYAAWVARGKIASEKKNLPINSRHFYGWAVDLSLNLNGEKVGVPGAYGSFNENATRTVAGKTFKIFDLYKLIDTQCRANNCEWGGYFRPYDPVHFQWTKVPVPAGVVAANESFEMYASQITLDPNSIYNADAGSATSLDSSVVDSINTSNNKVDTSHATTFIGHGLVLSDFSLNVADSKALNDLFAQAKVEEKVLNELMSFIGLYGTPAYTKASSTPSDKITITEENADAILLSQINSTTDYLINTKKIQLSNYPTEVSTAIVSYFFGKKMSSPDVNKDADSMLAILSSSRGKYDSLAAYIESRTSGLPSDVKSKRGAEAHLIRSYSYNVNKVEPSIASTNNQDDYSTNAAMRELQLANQLDEIDKLIHNRNTSSTTPASSEYDETFNDVDQSTLDAIGNLMQAQQVNTDIYFGFQEDEYLQRVKVKNFYSILSRNLNVKISKLDNMLQTEPILKSKQNISMAKMYSMIPYSDNLGYIVKKNAVARCEYRIRLIEKSIKDTESNMLGIGVPSADDWGGIAAFIATLWLKLAYNEVVELKNTVMSLFGTLAVLKEQLKLEQGNLVQLKRDVNRYAA